MNLRDAVVIVTGAGSGIGAALAERFAAEGAAAVVVADIDGARAVEVAARIGGVARQIDVTDEAAVHELVQSTVERFGRIDLFCSNAGVITGTGLGDSDTAWQRSWAVHVMAHVYAARATLPFMLAQGSGHLLNTASAAGLLSAPGDGPYSVTKHAAVGFAEWLAIEYGDRGIGVSVLCPMGVATPLLLDPLAAGDRAAAVVAASGDILPATVVADAVVAGLAGESFLILPHPEVGTFWARKAADPQRWLSSVRRLAGPRTRKKEPS